MTFTADQLQQVLDEHVQEGMYLDLKRGAALDKSSAARSELVKDCTGFANAGGGIILYGVAEENIEGVPAAASLSPVATPSIDSNWITNVLRSNTSPPLGHFDVWELDVPGGRVIAIEIEAAATAHQNLFDRRYYQRAGRSTEPMVDFQIRDVMSRKLRPEVLVEPKLVRKPLFDKTRKPEYRKAPHVSITNVGQVTLEKWRFEIDLPYEIIRDSDYPDKFESKDPLAHLSWVDGHRGVVSLVRDDKNHLVLRVHAEDPDGEQTRRLLHPGQTLILVDPERPPFITAELDNSIWRKIHGRSIFWRIFLNNARPIRGEWLFDDWCDF